MRSTTGRGLEAHDDTAAVAGARAMKPISTVPRALATVDMAPAMKRGIHQRSDVCAVPRGRVVETMSRSAGARLAGEVRGTRSPSAGQHRHVPARCGDRSRHAISARHRADGSKRDDRHAGVRQVHDRARLAKALAGAPAGYRRQIVETTGRSIADLLSKARGIRRIEEVVAHALAEHNGIVSLARDQIRHGVREALTAHVIFLEISAAEGSAHDSGTVRRCRGADPPEVPRPDERTKPLYGGPTMRVKHNAAIPRSVRHISKPREPQAPGRSGGAAPDVGRGRRR